MIVEYVVVIVHHVQTAGFQMGDSFLDCSLIVFSILPSWIGDGYCDATGYQITILWIKLLM